MLMSEMNRSHLPTPESNADFALIAGKVALTTSVNTAIEILKGDYAMVGVVMPATTSAALLTIHAAVGPGGTYGELYGDDGTALTVVVAQGRAVMLPPQVAPFGAIKLVSDVAVDVYVSRMS
jgi:hypothetical protein